MNKTLTTKQLALRWHVTEGHLANQRSKKKGIPYIQPMGKILYRIEDVEAFEDESQSK